EGPRTEQNSPRRTSNETSSTAVTEPNRFVTPRNSTLRSGATPILPPVVRSAPLYLAHLLRPVAHVGVPVAGIRHDGALPLTGRIEPWKAFHGLGVLDVERGDRVGLELRGARHDVRPVAELDELLGGVAVRGALADPPHVGVENPSVLRKKETDWDVLPLKLHGAPAHEW